jgi:hypothetical protein
LPLLPEDEQFSEARRSAIPVFTLEGGEHDGCQRSSETA